MQIGRERDVITRFLPMVVLLPLGVLGSLAWWGVQRPGDARLPRPVATLAQPVPAGCLRMAGFTAEGASAEFGDLGAPSPRPARPRC